MDAIETFAYSGEEPWHGKGVKLDGLASREEMIQAAGLDWKVGKVRAEFAGVPLYDWWYTVRQTDQAVLGVVGTPYHVIQNDALFLFLDNVIGQGEAVYETAGSLKGGRVCFATASVGQKFYIVPDDPIQPFVVTALSHDGSLQYSAFSSTIRPVCWNTFSAALNSAREGAGVVKIPHRSGAEAAIKQAHVALGLATRDASKLSKIFQQLAQQHMTIAQWNEFIKAMFPSRADETGKEPNRLIQLVRDYLNIAWDSPMNNLNADNRHTGWTALNAVTQFVDHYQSPKKGAVSPAFRSWFGEGLKIRTRAVKWLTKTLLKKSAIEEDPNYLTGLTEALAEDVEAMTL